METSLDQVREELADIHEQLLALPADAFDERSRLRDRQNELRALSHKLVGDREVHDAAHLRAAYIRLEELRDRMHDEKIAPSSVGNDAVWGELATAINKAIDAGHGLDDIEAQMRGILQELGGRS